MGERDREYVWRAWPEASSRTLVLSHDSTDIADPIGGPVEYYQRCAEQIQTQLTKRIPDLDL